ncbi:aminoacyl-tRNA hydrolase [Niveibacterium umoris]|uniref:Peptidyl-tRNA hydrolase n=1 Tax=Niveibacterium umoris TaxID=1193620 RepID=A0A840BKN7_9RHOO|nr:aminoacyl-tRNA hydrolase [Niveibacterium umoris]MBB4012994.1 PTH1 family peptidyl-tRNA hydrolase [Niveibacterium umoris]
MTQVAPKLVVGLGNPGPEYVETRHNAGFWFCELLARELGVTLSHESRFHGLAGNARSAGVWILLPQTFMNRSGQSVGALARFYRIQPNEILVVHDELDILPGQLKLKCGGGNGGHNGLKDIQAHLGTPDFWRLRIGIGHPGDRNQVANFVLHRPPRDEQTLIDESIGRALDAWPKMLAGEWERATAAVNTKPKPKA